MAGNIYVTGDCHGEFGRFNTRSFPDQRRLDKNDYVIICGDAACLWDDSKNNRYWLSWLNDKPFTTLYIDGNHENFDMLNALPTASWNGGKVHMLTPSVIHLMRGQVFQLGGKRLFTFGGAQSHDIQDGILDPMDPNFSEKQRKLRKKGGMYRINHISWWQEELPASHECDEGLKNLEAHHWNVDYIFTHTGPSSAVKVLGQDPGSLEDYLEMLKEKCTYSHWFFGHYHQEQKISARETAVYEQIHLLP